MKNDTIQRCYLCGIPLKRYKLKHGEPRAPDDIDSDHVPPKGLFPKPRPDNLIEVPCCFSCNNKHSGFDERLRIVASMPFGRNKAGQEILAEKVVCGTIAKGRQISFVKKILASMGTVPGRPELLRTQVDAQEFNEGMIQITKGLLFALHPGFDYYRSVFRVSPIDAQPFEEQLKLMAGLKKQGRYFERGQRVFQCWRHVEESRGVGCWMLVFYECFGFFVHHTNAPEETGHKSQGDAISDQP